MSEERRADRSLFQQCKICGRFNIPFSIVDSGEHKICSSCRAKCKCNWEGKAKQNDYIPNQSASTRCSLCGAFFSNSLENQLASVVKICPACRTKRQNQQSIFCNPEYRSSFYNVESQPTFQPELFPQNSIIHLSDKPSPSNSGCGSCMGCLGALSVGAFFLLLLM